MAFDPIVRQGNDTVWQRSSNRVIVSGSQITRVSPRDSLMFAVVWRLTDNDGRAVNPDVSEVIALLKDDAGRSIVGDNIRQLIRISPR